MPCQNLKSLDRKLSNGLVETPVNSFRKYLISQDIKRLDPVHCPTVQGWAHWYIYRCTCLQKIPIGFDPDMKLDYDCLEKNLCDDIDCFFTEQELSEMVDLEKLRYKNLRKNYEVLLVMGKTILYHFVNIWFIQECNRVQLDGDYDRYFLNKSVLILNDTSSSIRWEHSHCHAACIKLEPLIQSLNPCSAARGSCFLTRPSYICFRF